MKKYELLCFFFFSCVIFQEVRKVNQLDQSRGILSVPTQGGTGIVILTGTAKKKVTEQKNKGTFKGFFDVT